jgi:hypothetical protein
MLSGDFFQIGSERAITDEDQGRTWIAEGDERAKQFDRLLGGENFPAKSTTVWSVVILRLARNEAAAA